MINTIEELIGKSRWRQSWTELLRVLKNGTLSVQEFDTWGSYGGKIERGLGRRWTLRERFWRDLSGVIADAEVHQKVRTHKGLIYFKIGAMCLFNGRRLPTVMRWLERAYEEDQEFFNLHHDRLPE